MLTHIIDGKHVTSREVFEARNPATDEVITEVAKGGKEEIAAAVDAAKRAFPKWAGTAVAERARIMRNLADLIRKNVPNLAELETSDTGQVIAQTRNAMIPRSATNFDFFAEACVRVDGEAYQFDDRHINYTTRSPVGVCGLIAPWNAPFMLSTWKVAPCLALGNTAVLKMSEFSPLTAGRLGELALEAGVPAGVLNVVHGFGSTAGEALVTHPDVKAISFTGSSATGTHIIRQAGLKKTSMELGGKSPFIIFDDADYDRALDAALVMIFGNNGERCNAGSRIMVQESIYDRFVADFAERAKRIKVGDPMDPASRIGPMISGVHLEKVNRYIEIGVQEGATLVCGGGRPEMSQKFAKGHWIEPTVFADVDNRMRIAQEEIFGPVPCLIRFKDESDAVALANDIAYGLSAYVWTDSATRTLRMSAAIQAGMVFVNTQLIRELRQPFGGVKASGIGREGGHWSFELFTEIKNICHSLGTHEIPKWGTLD